MIQMTEVNADQTVEADYRKILEFLEASADKPAKPGRFEIFQQAVSLYLQETKTSWPEAGHDVFLIAGTNGKGTVAKTLETILADQGESVGLFTSPHLMETTERIRSGGRDLTLNEFVETFRFIENYVRRFELSHFEILTLMMIEVFFGDRVRPRVSAAVIEVGVGGRLDPTRVVPHEYAILTRIGLDHEAVLGPLPAIAREKFAIAEGARVVLYAPPDDVEVARAAFEAEKKFNSSQVQTQFIEIEPYGSEVVSISGTPRWKIRTPFGTATLSLLGERAVFNTSIALQATEASGRDVARALTVLKNVIWPGRMEEVRVQNRAIYLSGDHNPQGVESLRNLLESFEYESLWLVVGIGKNKDADSMLQLFALIPRVKFVLTATSFRPKQMSEYGVWLERAEAALQGPMDALEYALAHANANDLIVVSGSLYLVGDVRLKLLSRNQ